MELYCSPSPNSISAQHSLARLTAHADSISLPDGRTSCSGLLFILTFFTFPAFQKSPFCFSDWQNYCSFISGNAIVDGGFDEKKNTLLESSTQAYWWHFSVHVTCICVSFSFHRMTHIFGKDSTHFGFKKYPHSLRFICEESEVTANQLNLVLWWGLFILMSVGI